MVVGRTSRTGDRPDVGAGREGASGMAPRFLVRVLACALKTSLRLGDSGWAWGQKEFEPKSLRTKVPQSLHSTLLKLQG